MKTYRALAEARTLYVFKGIKKLEKVFAFTCSNQNFRTILLKQQLLYRILSSPSFLFYHFHLILLIKFYYLVLAPGEKGLCEPGRKGYAQQRQKGQTHQRSINVT